MTDNSKRVFSSTDAAPVVLYSKKTSSDDSASPLLSDQYGNLMTTMENINSLLIVLGRLLDSIQLSQTIDMASYRQRVTAILESTTLTTCSTVTALGTVGTTNIPQAQDMVLGANLSAWALCCRERIS